MYEPSTTGWDDTPTVKFFTTQAAANAHAKQSLKKRLTTLRELAEEGCFASDSDFEAASDDRKRKSPQDKWPLVPPASLFSGDFPKCKRSKLFGKDGCTIDHGHTEKSYGSGLYVGLIRNFHGDYMDGCANPEMEEIAWTEEHQVQPNGGNSQFLTTKTPPDAQPKKRPAAALGCVERLRGKSRR
mmetsp:Transcript_25923/g.52273  ORF Transcript_25923/g.52273 Transcript_25923/m.52273 type:complete len:185 (-) Transcript_25923:86-640(-)